MTVFVAASLADVTGEFAAEFTRTTGVEVDTSVAASGILRRQIEADAPCDVFISADEAEMDLLAQKQGVVDESRRELASNQLVIVATNGSSEWPTAKPLAEISGKIAIGDPRYVPAGRYARQALKDLKLWNALEDRLVLADNVRVALQYVRSRQVVAALVYATDAMGRECKVVYRFPTDSGRIACHGAICTRSNKSEDAAAFLRMMVDSKHADIWKRHGFTLIPRDAEQLTKD
ncbi:MAG: molybdate-binding periplasmic protein [Phycisphaerae bacterium]|nr:MAG: molybdate-binding periplasmic protein [Phycisphaerae bacterium]